MFVKVILPLAWLSLFGWTTTVAFLGREHQRWPMLMFAVAGAAYCVAAGAPLKRVRVGGRVLYVSNFVREVRVPASNILRVSQNFWFGVGPVTIELREANELGRRIVFMPTARFLQWRSHPVVAELRALAASAGAPPPR